MLLLLGCLSFGLMLYLFWFLFKGKSYDELCFSRAVFLFVLLILAAPLGFYIKMIMTGRRPVSSALSNRSSAVSIG